MWGMMPKHNKSRRSGEGKSRPDTPPTQRGSRSKVIWRGRPYWRKKVITASNAVCSWKSSRAWADRAIEVPASTQLQTSTTCWRLPCELCSGETLPTSLRIHLDFFQRLAELALVRRLLGTGQQTTGG